MALPGIDISFQNGALGNFAPNTDSVFGAMIQMAAVGSLTHGSCHLVSSFQAVVNLGLTDSVANHVAYKFFKEFYDEAGTGAQLYFMVINNDIAWNTWFETANPAADTLLLFSGKTIKGFFAVWNPVSSYTSTVTNGLDANVEVMKAGAQAYLNSKLTGFDLSLFAVIDGYNYNGTHASLPNLRTENKDRVAVLIGDTEARNGTTASKGSAMGLLAGRMAKNAIQENVGKVKKGALAAINAYIVSTLVDNMDVTPLHDKGYITLRTISGKDGYFFTDDPIAVPLANDYNSLALRRVADKAYGLVYATLADEINSDIDLLSSGVIDPISAKDIENKVIQVLYNQMALQGNLSLDKSNANDKGCVVQVDRTHNIASSNTLKLSICQIRPKGYAKYITVPLGFVPVTVV